MPVAEFILAPQQTPILKSQIHLPTSTTPAEPIIVLASHMLSFNGTRHE